MNNIKDAMQELSDLGQELEQASEEERLRMDKWWEALSTEDQMNAFYSVVSRIVKGDITENKSYRGVLYDTFEFGSESYGLGMDCGYMVLHNSIIPINEQSTLRTERREAIDLIKAHKDVIGADADKFLSNLKGDHL